MSSAQYSMNLLPDAVPVQVCAKSTNPVIDRESSIH